MSRRKKRSRSPSPFTRGTLGVGRPGAASFPDILSQILAKAPSPVVEHDPVSKWYEATLDALDEIPEELIEAFQRARPRFEYRPNGLFADGLITAQCIAGGGTAGGESHNVFVNLMGSQPPAGCSCEQSRGQKLCLHTYGLLDNVFDLLEFARGPLPERIRDRRFDRQKPDMKIFQFDPSSEVRRVLEGLIPTKVPAAAELEDESSLPPVAEQSVGRIAWNIVIKNSNLEVLPMLQQAKKRGDGWTKGRKLPFDSLGEHGALFSEADRKVRDLVRIDTTYYRATYHLNSVDALKRLVGQPNVMLDGVPTEVKLTAPEVVVVKDSESIRLSVRGSLAGSSHYVFTSDSMLHFRMDNATVDLCAATSQQIESLRKIVKMPRIGLSHEKEVLETAQRLQGFLTVHLPEEVAGKLVDEDYRPVLLLRSRSDGALDYGLRLRDSSGHLHIAGRGQMLRKAERGGETVQLARSATREHRLSQQLTERFQLTSGELHGTIDSFEVALELIERLHTAEAEGDVEILWDKSSQKPLRVLGAVTAKNVSVGISRKRDWFQLSGSCDLGNNQSIELSELLSGLQTAGVDAVHGDFVRLGDRGWAKVSQQFRQQLRQLHDSVNQERGTLKFDATSAPAIRNLLAEQVEMKATAAWNQCLNRLEQAEKLEPILPTGVNAELRDYQIDGFKWLRRLAEWGVGGILADDMGLGKTLQTLAVILDRATQGPTLVIAPTSVGFNWVREAQKFTPDLDVHLYRETERADFLHQVGPQSLVVCSYGLALRDADALAGIEWSTLVLDEAQAIKNSRSKTAAAIATIPADWKVALTGTPVENHLGELWSLFHVVSPGVLGGWEQFRRRFAAPIEKDNDEDRRMALRDRLRPFLLRRTKDEVLKDLPPRTEMNLYVEMSPAEREIYNSVRLSALGEIDQLAKLSDVKDQRFRILALLTRMRQLACSPRLVHETWKERSSKLQQLCDTLHELRDEGHRVLVFSQFVKHLTLIREMLDEEKISYEYLDGSTDPKARQERVDSFQNGDATAFLISLKAGGTGLNLTAADYVIHMDPWWNPAVEDQATDRAHRIGQDKPVMVYRLISQGTIEEEILRLHDTKRDLVAGIMEGSQAAAKLSTEDLVALLRG